MRTAKTRHDPPRLGAEVVASGYLVRYQTGGGDFENNPDKGAKGWKRERERVRGVYFGTRVLRITWWHRYQYSDDHHDSDDRVEVRTAAHLTVYAIAINRRAVRYVLPRDLVPMVEIAA